MATFSESPVMSIFSKRMITLVVFAIVTIGAYVWYQWNKPARDARHENGIDISAAQLMEEYRRNEQQANASYLDKTLLVKGEVKKLSTNQQGQRVVELSTALENGTIFCTIASDEKGHIDAGTIVQLKGICKGYRDQMLAVDVVLQDCYLYQGNE